MRCCNAAQCTSAATFWHTPERLYEEISADYSDMVYAGRTKDIEARRKSFIRKWPLKCRAIADSLEEAGDRWFTFHSVARQPWRTGLEMTCSWIGSQVRRNFQNEKAAA
jgi:hypothetical protein